MGRKSDNQKQAEKDMAQFNVNYAGNAAIADRALEYLQDMIIGAKTARGAKEQEWLEDLRLWACQNSDIQMYNGRNGLVIPELHNQVETSVGQFISGLFPNNNYLGCIPVKASNAEDAQRVKEAVFHELDHKNNLPSLMERFERQKVLYGNAFLKPVFEKTMKTVVVKDPKGYVKTTQVPAYQGVKVHCMDTFHTYVWPENANSVQEAQLCFDEDFVFKRELERSGLYKNLDKVTELQPDYQNYGWIDTIRMTINNLSTAATYRKNGVLVTECWCDFDIVKGEYVPCVITLLNYSVVGRIQRNPFWHQSKPYLQGRYIKGPAAEAYGHSLPERLRSLQYMMTDIANQTMDSLTYALNPIALIDPAFAGDVNSFKIQPGARWFASPQGVEFKTFPDISQVGFAGMQQVRGMIQQFSDLTPKLAPQLTGKVRSATQSAAVQNEISDNQRNMILADEFEVMSPLAEMTHWLLKQFQDEAYQVAVQGPENGQWITKQVNPEMLQKDVMFVWRGSEVESVNAIRNQQMISAFNMALQTERILPGKIDVPKLYLKVMDEAFNLKDLDINLEARQKMTVDPEIENMSLGMGEDCPVNPGDNYKEHMATHGSGYLKAKTQEAKLAYLQHMDRHEIQKQAQDKIRQQEAQIEAMKMQLNEEQGEGEAMGMPQGGNPGQTQNSVASITQGMRAVEPNV